MSANYPEWPKLSPLTLFGLPTNIKAENKPKAQRQGIRAHEIKGAISGKVYTEKAPKEAGVSVF